MWSPRYACTSQKQNCVATCGCNTSCTSCWQCPCQIQLACTCGRQWGPFAVQCCPERHYVCHMEQQARYLNPRTSNTMLDETFMGVINDVAKSCSHGSDPHKRHINVVKKYRWALHCLFKIRRCVLSYLMYLRQSNKVMYTCVCHATDMHVACKGMWLCPCIWNCWYVRGGILKKTKTRCTMHNAQCTLHNAQCTMHNAQCTMHSALCTMHNAHSIGFSYEYPNNAFTFGVMIPVVVWLGHV